MPTRRRDVPRNTPTMEAHGGNGLCLSVYVYIFLENGYALPTEVSPLRKMLSLWG